MLKLFDPGTHFQSLTGGLLGGGGMWIMKRPLTGWIGQSWWRFYATSELITGTGSLYGIYTKGNQPVCELQTVIQQRVKLVAV